MSAEKSLKNFPTTHNKTDKLLTTVTAIAAGVIVILSIQKGIPSGQHISENRSELPKNDIAEKVTTSSTQEKSEEILALFQKKIEKDPAYTPTRNERIALAQLGIAVNDGEPIPYDGDRKENK